jgi:hypothetical protein
MFAGKAGAYPSEARDKHSSLMRKFLTYGRLSLASLSSLVYFTFARPGAYPRVEQLKGSSKGQALALPTSIRVSWRGLLGTNTLAY